LQRNTGKRKNTRKVIRTRKNKTRTGGLKYVEEPVQFVAGEDEIRNFRLRDPR
jgi:hypothetical protein